MVFTFRNPGLRIPGRQCNAHRDLLLAMSTYHLSCDSSLQPLASDSPNFCRKSKSRQRPRYLNGVQWVQRHLFHMTGNDSLLTWMSKDSTNKSVSISSLEEVLLACFEDCMHMHLHRQICMHARTLTLPQALRCSSASQFRLKPHCNEWNLMPRCPVCIRLCLRQLQTACALDCAVCPEGRERNRAKDWPS